MVLILFGFLLLAAVPASIGQLLDNNAEFMGRNSRTYPLDLTGRITKPICVDIPEDLSLCHSIGYTQMRMPNLLDHDSMEEVRHQAQSWVPLLLQQCHPDTQLFLCSLFAPVCLDRPIYPCRSLCEEVRAGCAPLMESNCFPWPSMLNCENFPPDNDLCIKSEMREQNGTMTSQDFELPSAMQERYMSLFTQCHDDSSLDTLVQKYCMADFVLKMKIKNIKDSKDGKKFFGDSSEDRLQVIKRGSLKSKDLKRLQFYVREGANCRCTMLDESGNYLLVMGHRDGHRSRKLFMTFVHSWQKTRDFRRKMNVLKEADVCTNYMAATDAVRIDSTTHAQNAHGVDTADTPLDPTASDNMPIDEMNSPMRDEVPGTELGISETPSTTTNTPGSKNKKRKRERGKKNKGTRRRQRQLRERRVESEN